MIATCRCGEIIVGPGPLQLPPGADDQTEYAALELATATHFALRHAAEASATMGEAAHFVRALLSKFFTSSDPRFVIEQNESFKLLYWLLMGTLHMEQTARFPPFDTIKPNG